MNHENTGREPGSLSSRVNLRNICQRFTRVCSAGVACRRSTRLRYSSQGQNSWIILNRPGLHASLACGGGQWGRQEAGAPSPLGPGTWLSSVVLPAATRGCPPRREGARLLLVGPLGLLLLDECLHADLLVLGREGRIEEHPLEPQALRQRGFEGGVDERLRKRGNRLRV